MNGSFESIDTILANLKQANIPQGTGKSTCEAVMFELSLFLCYAVSAECALSSVCSLAAEVL